MISPPLTASTQSDPTILTYNLPDLLPNGSTLVLNTELGILSLIQEGHILKQELLTERETYVLLALLQLYPDYCPYEHILAAFYESHLSTNNIARYRDKIHLALKEKKLDDLMKESRCLLSRIRKLLRAFGISIKAIVVTGYILISDPLPVQSKPQQSFFSLSCIRTSS